jgi:3-oxoacyl-[acyl-carrier protein] reductase
MAEQQVIAITGTSRGIGLGMAKYFVGHGHIVVGCSRGMSSFAVDNYLHTELDVGDEHQVRRWIRATARTYGRLDVMVCNAGLVPAPGLMVATTAETLDATFRTNVRGLYTVYRESAKAMMLRRHGRIVAVSSMAVGLHDEGTSIYSASKSAVVEMTKVLAKELASFGITCNVVAPSVYLAAAIENLGESVVARAIERLTIKRPCTIDEICKVVEFFAAPESSCITGQVMHLGLVV